MKVDSYGEVVNDPTTYHDVALALLEGSAPMIGWTDGRGTHYDVVFCRPQLLAGTIQGVHPLAQQAMGRHLLYVGIMRRGGFTFVVEESRDPFHPLYVAEKLNVAPSPTAEKLAELINGVVGGLRSVFQAPEGA